MAKFQRRLPGKGVMPFRYVLLLSFIFFVFSTAAGLYIVNKEIQPVLMSIAETETQKIASLIINDALKKELEEEGDTSRLVQENVDEKGKLTDFNAAGVRKMMASFTDHIQRNLILAEKGNLAVLNIPELQDSKENFIYEIPLGQTTGNVLLGSVGPKIPVRFEMVGHALTDSKITAEPFGINNALIKVIIDVKVNLRVIIPFSSKSTTVSANIPVDIKTFSGDVPDYYNGGGGQPPAIELK
ncbi:sporulation protein YunB [Bacillus sp. FJAT-42376]|uniref:sporulation protein YunB n=1 Tax=Bacillus sp. FJAT-42376 TaxID=2014076 RepID=UPI000F4E9625|nr:sporulation protein YunB [Bacillus sp. FJAT-42376]AZB44295.1 sporulation protein YunB [Bacillus sp. FJAT-42376]